MIEAMSDDRGWPGSAVNSRTAADTAMIGTAASPCSKRPTMVSIPVAMAPDVTLVQLVDERLVVQYLVTGSRIALIAGMTSLTMKFLKGRQGAGDERCNLGDERLVGGDPVPGSLSLRRMPGMTVPR